MKKSQAFTVGLNFSCGRGPSYLIIVPLFLKPLTTLLGDVPTVVTPVHQELKLRVDFQRRPKSTLIIIP